MTYQYFGESRDFPDVQAVCQIVLNQTLLCGNVPTPREMEDELIIIAIVLGVCLLISCAFLCLSCMEVAMHYPPRAPCHMRILRV